MTPKVGDRIKLEDAAAKLRDVVRDYLREYDTPVPDYAHRVVLRNLMKRRLAEYSALSDQSEPGAK